MTKPTTLALTKPEEGARSPAIVDDSKLLGLLASIDRFQVGEVDSITLADTLDTFAAILRQIISGEDLSGSYLKYPVKSIDQIATDIADINTAIDRSNTVELTATVAINQFSFIKLSGNYSMDLAVADAPINAKSIGCLIDTTKNVGETGIVAVSGKVVEGILSGATYGTKYYLDPVVAGGITTTPPTNGVLLEVGVALSETDLLLDIKRPIIRISS
jgi:hypothetical protein